MTTRSRLFLAVLGASLAGARPALAEITAAAAPVPAASLTPPTWRVGDTWTLKVRYRELELGAKVRAARGSKNAPEPSRPPSRLQRLLEARDPLVTYWTYKVVSADQLAEGTRGWVIQAKDKDGHKDALSSLLFRETRALATPPTTDPAPVLERGLSEGKFMAVQAGESKLQRLVFWQPPDSPRPVMAQESPIPHTFPVLPLAAAGAQVFPETRFAGEMAFAFDASQIVTLGVNAADLPGGAALVKRLRAADLPVEGLTMVELSRDFDGAYVRQLWAKGYPWAIYGEDASSQYHLVYHSLRKGP